MNNTQNLRKGADRSSDTQDRQQPSFPMERIKLAQGDVPMKLFSEVAEQAAEYVAKGKPDSKPTPTQLRKFYDEICRWNSKIQQQPDRFTEHLPFILMLKAKVAYAKGRGYVNDNYFKLLEHCLKEIQENPQPETLNNLKLFMEAFTGFYKV